MLSHLSHYLLFHEPVSSHPGVDGLVLSQPHQSQQSMEVHPCLKQQTHLWPDTLSGTLRNKTPYGMELTGIGFWIASVLYFTQFINDSCGL